MKEAQFKTLRHCETVRNYLNLCIRELLHRGEQHDQTKLQDPEREGYAVLTNKLRGSTYGSPEYHGFLTELKPVIDHHYQHNRHHPEHFDNGIHGMTLIDLLEMLMDWKASGMRHDDGDLFKSIEINQKRFWFTDELKNILENTAKWVNDQDVFHKANES